MIQLFIICNISSSYIIAICLFTQKYRARFGSLTCMELLLKIPDINVNQRNKKEGNTPLHLAVQYEEDPEVGLNMVDILIDAGADPR